MVDSIKESVLVEEYFWDIGVQSVAEDYPEGRLSGNIIRYSFPFFLVLGTLGNLTAAFIYARMVRPVLSTCVYLVVELLIELLVLYTTCCRDWILVLTGGANDIRKSALDYSESSCKIYPFVADCGLYLSPWLLAAAAVETALVTCRPQRFESACRAERARAVILLILVLLICASAHSFWTYSLINVENELGVGGGASSQTVLQRAGGNINQQTAGGSSKSIRVVCLKIKQGNRNNELFRKIILPIIEIVIVDLLPYFVVFSCAVIVVTTWLKRQENVQLLDTARKTTSLDWLAAKQCQRSFLAIWILYLLLMLPKFAFNIFRFLVDPSRGVALLEYSFPLAVRMDLASTVCNLLFYVFLSCKFPLFIATSSRFRSDVWWLVTCGRQGCATLSGSDNPDLDHNSALRSEEARHRLANCNHVVENHLPQPNELDVPISMGSKSDNYCAKENNAVCFRKFTTTSV